MRMMTAMTMMTLKMMSMMMKTVMIIAKSHLDLLDLLRGRLSRVGACVQGLGQVRLARHGGGQVVKESGSGAGSRAVVWQDVQQAAAVRALRAVDHVGRACVLSRPRLSYPGSGDEIQSIIHV